MHSVQLGLLRRLVAIWAALLLGAAPISVSAMGWTPRVPGAGAELGRGISGRDTATGRIWGATQRLNSGAGLRLAASGVPGSASWGIRPCDLEIAFQADLYDYDVGLYLARARVLDSRTGTFLQRDPSGFADSINLYAFARNNPVNHRDPTGRLTPEEAEAAAAGLRARIAAEREYVRKHGLRNPWPGLVGAWGLTAAAGVAFEAAPVASTLLVTLGGVNSDDDADILPTLGLGVLQGLAAFARAGAAANTRPYIEALRSDGALGGLSPSRGAPAGLQTELPTDGTLAPRSSQAGEAGLGAPEVATLNPASLRISQRSVTGTPEVAESMQANGWQGDPIDVVRMSDGRLTSVDNTRVLAAHRAGIEVKVRIHAADEALSAEFVERFTTSAGSPKTWGDAMRLRIQKQGAAFRSRYPNGSPVTGSND